MTRARDIDCAIELGAAYVGLVFAESPRRLSVEAAVGLARHARGQVRVVGVFGGAPAEEIALVADAAGLDAVQLHADPTGAAATELRQRLAGEVWGVMRIAGAELPAGASRLFGLVDAVVLDAMVVGRLGGTGTAFDWAEAARALDRCRGQTRIVLAGGLSAHNVARGIATLAPDVVDVSSGVESAPGIKDHARMRAFADAVRGASCLMPHRASRGAPGEVRENSDRKP